MSEVTNVAFLCSNKIQLKKLDRNPELSDERRLNTSRQGGRLEKNRKFKAHRLPPFN